MADDEQRSSRSILDSMGEDMMRIVTPVSTCMLLVVLLVSALSSSSLSPLTSTTTTNSPSPSSSPPWADIAAAIETAAGFVGAVTAMTFLMLLLFYLRCTSCLKYYLAFSTLTVLLLLGAVISLSLLSHFRLPLDAVTYSFLLLNFSGIGVVAVFAAKSVPIALNQAYLVLIGVFTAYWFTLLPEWTTWALLVAMSVYDLAAVLLPGGPLRLLVELAMSRNEEIPALVYEARPVDPQPGQNWRLWRERRNLDDAGASLVVVEGIIPSERSSLDANSRPAQVMDTQRRGLDASLVVEDDQIGRERRDLEDLHASASVISTNATLAEVLGRERRDVEANLAIPETGMDSEMRVPLMQLRPDRGREREGEDGEEEGIGLSSSGAIKLGLGDFIFYSVLVGRAAMYDYMTVYACYLAIIAGLGITLLLLAFFRKALPALPVSIMLGVLFYVLTRALLEVFVVQCATNLLMF